MVFDIKRDDCFFIIPRFERYFKGEFFRCSWFGWELILSTDEAASKRKISAVFLQKSKKIHKFGEISKLGQPIFELITDQGKTLDIYADGYVKGDAIGKHAIIYNYIPCYRVEVEEAINNASR